ncbi:MAG: VIT1/CCC1 transporter family protein [Thermoplasmata archaeon]
MDPILEFYKGEILDSEMYRKFAKYEKNKGLKSAFEKLAEIEASHANFWKKFGENKKLDFSKIKISRFKIAALILMRRLFGLGIAIKLLEGNEDNAVIKYYEYSKSQDPDSPEFKLIKNLVIDELVHEAFFVWDEKEMNVENVRDSIYGVSDGLVEVLAAVSGFAGLIENSLIIAMTGLIVGVAGTLSMAAGAFVSSKSQKELQSADIQKLMVQVNVAYEDIKLKLKELFLQRGVKEQEADKIVTVMGSEKKGLVDAMAKEYLGFTEETLENPKASAIRTGVSYFFGAIIPVIPYILAIKGIFGVVTSFILSGLALGIVGALVSITSGVSMHKKVTEMILIGIGAAIATYLIGFGARYFLHISVF